jgi:hypothetical protein
LTSQVPGQPDDSSRIEIARSGRTESDRLASLIACQLRRKRILTIENEGRAALSPQLVDKESWYKSSQYVCASIVRYIRKKEIGRGVADCILLAIRKWGCPCAKVRFATILPSAEGTEKPVKQLYIQRRAHSALVIPSLIIFRRRVFLSMPSSSAAAIFLPWCRRRA